MNISELSYQNSNIYNNSCQKTQKNRGNITNTISTPLSQNHNSEEIIGLSMINDSTSNQSWGMKAKYAEGSTAENPIICVETNYGGKTTTYNININDINPNNASRIEMFALCSYADDNRIGDKSTFGTFQTLKSYEDMSFHNGYLDRKLNKTSTWEQLQNIKLNWKSSCENMLDLLYKCNDISQYNKGLDIINLLSKYPVK